MENETFLEEFKKYIADPKSRLVIFFGVAVFSIVSIALVFLVINNSNVSQEMAAAKKIEENPSQKADILSQIVKNNPKSSVNSTPSNTATSPTSVQDKFNGNRGYVAIDPSTGLPVGLSASGNQVGVGPTEQPDLTKYNYRKTTETVTPGVLSNVCGYPYSYVSEGRYLTSEFFDNNNSYYVRNNEYADGTLKGFYNSQYGKDVNETYVYAGGTYAVKEKYKPYWYTRNSTDSVLSYPVPNYNPASNPVSSPAIDEIIRNYFGGNAVIERVYQQANRTFYEIQVSYQYNCTDNSNPAVAPYLDSNGNVTFVSLETVDSQSFEITNTKTYLNSVITENLISVRDYKVEYKLTDFNSVSSEFQNIAAPQVRTVDWSNYQFDPVEYANRVSNYMKDNAIELLLPQDDANIAYLSSKNTPSALPNADYYKDRDFYSPGANGDSTYAALMKRYGPEVSLLNYSLTTSNNYSTYWFSQYEGTADYVSILKSFESYGSFGTTEFTKSINIDGQQVDVLLRQNVYGFNGYYSVTSYPTSYILDLANRYPTISEASYPLSFPNSGYYYVNYQFLFQYNGKIYRGSLDGWAIDRFLNENFQNINPADQQGFIRLSELVSGGIYGDGYGYGYGYGFAN